MTHTPLGKNAMALGVELEEDYLTRSLCLLIVRDRFAARAMDHSAH